MLGYERIKEISALKGVVDIVVEKNYILDWVLWGISQNEYLRNSLVFKGGTALHKMYFSDWRFSEDLDFTTIEQVKKEELEKAIAKLCNIIGKRSDITLQQREVNVSGEGDSEWSFEVKIEYIGPRKQTGGNLSIILLHITSDELLIDKPLGKMVIALYEDLLDDFTILTYSLEEIFAEKIRTVFHQRCWPRDIYDIWRLLNETRNFINIEKTIDIYNRKSIYRGFNPGIPSTLGERILRIKNQWKEGLQRQINAPPDFGRVYPNVIVLSQKLFKDYATIKKGDVTMLETQYSIRYKNDKLEIEVQGDKNFVEEKFKEILELNMQEPTKKDVSFVSSGQLIDEVGKKTSLGEFLRLKNPKSHGDKILVFGYFLEKVKGLISFNLDDVETCYKEARIPKTKNFSPYVTQLIRDGHLMDADQKKDSKKAWLLTDSGLKYVESLVPDS